MMSIKNSYRTIIIAAAVCLAALPLSAKPINLGGDDARAALRAADSLSKAPGVSGQVKAQSFKALGDHQFIKGDYKKAAEFYQQASMLDNSSEYRYLYALSIAADGQTALAADILRAIAAVSADPMGGYAAELLEQLKADNQQTASANQQAAPVSQPKPVSVPAAPQPEPRTSQQPPVSTDKPAAPATAANAVFTIQVGAFGTKENADNLVKRLSQTYKDITVSPTTSGDQTLYRVRIGTFQSREEAVAFADKLITEGGMSARVVEK